MELFARCDREPERLLAVDESGACLTLGDLNDTAEALRTAVGRHRLVFILCENTPGCLLGYLSCLKTGAVPLLLDALIAPHLLERLISVYHPGFFFVPRDLAPETRRAIGDVTPVLDVRDGVLLRTGRPGPELHPELALLLTTSGSTGSPKLVRLTGKNLDANAASIVEYLGITETERPITNLMMSYSYGMSIINTHVRAGAPIVLTRRSVLERAFWELMERERVTSLAGVPYTYQMFRRVGLMEMDLPCLRTLTQAGGRLPEEVHRAFAQWAADTGRRFFVMYGQTEAGPRMGYLPAGRALEKCGSMGIPIPGGKIRLVDGSGGTISSPGEPGEIVYQGENVAMGYAETAEELALGDRWHGELYTGDMARQDAEGFYYIEGRKKRFIKLFGTRVNLDEAERLVAACLPGAGAACAGRDDCLTVFLDDPSPEAGQAAVDCLSQALRFPPRAFSVQVVDAIPKNEAGKTLYAALQRSLK